MSRISAAYPAILIQKKLTPTVKILYFILSYWCNNTKIFISVCVCVCKEKDFKPQPGGSLCDLISLRRFKRRKLSTRSKSELPGKA